jgi:hypothetical protein
MSKVNKKYIDFGTTGNKVNSQDLPANFTPSNYTPAQVGSEGTDKVSAHLKGVDTALASVPTSSTGDISETSFSLSQSQTNANVTNFAFANASVRSFEALVSVEIDATADLFEVFTLRGIQRGSDWSLSASSNGDNSGITFSITTAGQIQYSSTAYSGFSSGSIKFRAITTSV